MDREAILEYELIMSSIESSEELELIQLYSILEEEVLELSSTITPISIPVQERKPSSRHHSRPHHHHAKEQHYYDGVKLPEFMVKFLNFFSTSPSTTTSNQESNKLFPYLRINPFSPPRRGPLLTTSSTSEVGSTRSHRHQHHHHLHRVGGHKKLRCKLRKFIKSFKNLKGLKSISFLCGLGFLFIIFIRLIKRNLSARRRNSRVGVISLGSSNGEGENEKVFDYSRRSSFL